MNKKQTKILDIVYGIHPAIELLKAKRRAVHAIYTTKDTKAFGQIERLLPTHIKPTFVDKNRLASFAGTADHQGVVITADSFVYQKTFFDPKKSKLLILLDRIQDPRNAGAIIRSAYCTNADGIILIDKGGTGITPTVLKASAGLAEHCTIYRAPSVGAAAQNLRDAGYTIYVGDAGGTAIQKVEFVQPCCLIVGSEGVGAASLFKEHGHVIQIPQKRPDISYNASVAAGIMLFWAGLKLGRIG